MMHIKFLRFSVTIVVINQECATVNSVCITNS